jgi:hypothetical protein
MILYYWTLKDSGRAVEKNDMALTDTRRALDVSLHGRRYNDHSVSS